MDDARLREMERIAEDCSQSVSQIRDVCRALIDEVHRLRKSTICREIQKRDAIITAQVNRIYELEDHIARLEYTK